MDARFDISSIRQPSTLHTQHMLQETTEKTQAAGNAPSLDENRGADLSLRDELEGLIEGLRPVIIDLSHQIHSHPETGFNEHFAMATVGGLLDKYRIPHEDGVFSLPTALRASIGTTEGNHELPTFALTCEYDALPGVGHGCGHNVMCAQTVGAFIGLSLLNRSLEGGLPGRVILQTTPAEENSTCKEVLFQRGAFDNVDAVAMAHSYGTDVAHQTWLGQKRIKVQFTGIAAHASSAPFMGRNALDAAVLSLNGVGLLRQQIFPSDRIHAVITDGGDVPNVIPKSSELNVTVRSKYLDTLQDLLGRVYDVFRGAALMTGTSVEIIEDELPNECPVYPNSSLLKSWVRSQRRRGRNPLPHGVVSEVIAAGTDFGNLSTRIPGIHPLVSVGDSSIMLHTKEMAQAAISPRGDAAAVDGAFGLASVVLDFIFDSDFRREVLDDFERTEG